MSDVDSGTIGATVFAVVLGLSIIVIGFVLYLRSIMHSHRCTETADGVVYDIVDEGHHKKIKEEPVQAANEDIAKKKRAYQTKKRAQAQKELEATAATWRPMVRYTVGDHTYEARARRGVVQNRFKVGQSCEVHYDPKKPSYCWLQIDGLARWVSYTLMICGAALILVGVAIWFILPSLEASV